MDSVSDNHNYVPSLVFLETTRACDYACRHCRAESIPSRSPDELTTSEIREIFDQIRMMDTEVPEVIITGGNLLLRDDIREIISYAAEIGLPFSVSPSSSPLLTGDFLKFLKNNGTGSLSLSLDGTADGSHDWLRGLPGSFDFTVGLIRKALKAGIKVQINTTVMDRNTGELPEIAAIVKDLGVSAWEIFYLIKTGRGIQVDEITPSQYMQINSWLADLSGYGINVRTVEGPVHRVIKSIRTLNRGIAAGKLYDELSRKTKALMGEIPVKNSEPDPEKPAGKPGHHFRGTLFISSTGEVYPTGLLPLSLGSTRTETLDNIISGHIAELTPRTSGRLKGKCGICNFMRVCGGSRARAFSRTGDMFSEDPACLYIPAAQKAGAT